MPSLFDDSNYEQGKDPFGGNAAVTFNILTQEWPCTVPPFAIESCTGIILKGLNIIESDEEKSLLVLITGSTGVEVHYCKTTGGVMAMTVNDFSFAEIYNVYLKENTVGLVATGNAMLNLVGENFIHDSTHAGVYALLNSTVVQTAMENCPTKCVTEIRTTAPQDKYSAVSLSDGSRYKILTKYLSEGDIPLCYLKIINENAYKAKEYFGVSLEALSCFSGTDKTTFADKDLNQGNDTVPEDNQFKTDESALVKK